MKGLDGRDAIGQAVSPRAPSKLPHTSGHLTASLRFRILPATEPFQVYRSTPVGKPDPKNARLDVIEQAVKIMREVRPPAVPVSEFTRLMKIPIVIYYGDNIPDKPSANPGQEQWRVFLEAARRWRDAVNKRGGNVTLVHLPEAGVRGNTHFPMSDLNNLQIADLLSRFLKEKGLD